MKVDFYYGDNKNDSRNDFFYYYENLCKKKIHYIKSKYNFEFVQTEMMGKMYIASSFKNLTTGIFIDYDQREGLFVRIVELDNNEMGLYDIKRWHYVEELLINYSPEEKINKSNQFALSKEEYIESTIDKYLDVLKKYGDPVLKGDFSSFRKK